MNWRYLNVSIPDLAKVKTMLCAFFNRQLPYTAGMRLVELAQLCGSVRVNCGMGRVSRISQFFIKASLLCSLFFVASSYE